MRNLLIALALFASVGPALAKEPSPPPPARTEYLTTEGAGFIVHGGKLSYATDFRVNKPSSEPLYAVVSFQSAAPDEPLADVEVVVEPGQETFRATSGPMSKIKNGYVYSVTVSLFSDAAHRQLLGQHQQGILFYAPEPVLTQLGVTSL